MRKVYIITEFKVQWESYHPVIIHTIMALWKVLWYLYPPAFIYVKQWFFYFMYILMWFLHVYTSHRQTSYIHKNRKHLLLNGPFGSAHSSTDKICTAQHFEYFEKAKGWFYCVLQSEGVFLDSLLDSLNSKAWHTPISLFQATATDINWALRFHK